MKMIPLKTAEEFCREHNFQSISIKQLRDLAIDATETEEDICFKTGYGQAMNDLSDFLRAKSYEY